MTFAPLAMLSFKRNNGKLVFISSWLYGQLSKRPMAYFSPFDNVYTLIAFAHAAANENREAFGLAQIPARTRGEALVPLGQKGRRPHVLRGPGARARAR